MQIPQHEDREKWRRDIHGKAQQRNEQDKFREVAFFKSSHKHPQGKMIFLSDLERRLMHFI